MSKIIPFRGLRPAADLVTKVASLPYDVMDTEEARKMVEGNPKSFLHVTRSEVDLDPNIDPYNMQVYEKARQTLDQFIKDGIMIQDPKPCFYVYKQKMGNHVQVGLVAGASVDEYQAGTIKKHELTRADKELDRTNHVNITGAQTGPVFLTYRAVTAINHIMEKVMEQKPVYDFVAEDGIGHTLYVVNDDNTIKAIENEFAKLNVLYIADGHHRSASASAVRELRKKENPNHTGNENYNYFLAVIFPHDMMQIMDYNRVVKDLNGLSTEEFLKRAGQVFTIERLPQGSAPAKPTQRHHFGMYLQGSWYRITAKPGTFDEKDPVAALDVSILQENLLSPVLAIGNPRTDKRINFVGGIRGMKELEKRVDQDGYAVAFAFYPTAIEELMAIADAGKIMPPKSTWFEPKLRDAMVVHKL
ncbi:MAG TPA: DUF1015 domain-containing protein [Firmicutes bacterium]|jgi:uncharacterized protein (DUF1015 family)|nr:DUF1015 domain-containing protein [Bacillota bacterium]